MTWRNLEVCWIETDHQFDSLGEVMVNQSEIPNEMLAQGIVVWKKISLADFVEKIGKLVFGIDKFARNKDFLSAAILTFSIISLLPFHLKIIRNDEIALRFINLFSEDDDGKQFIRESDLKDYEDIIPLIEYFVEQNLLEKKDERYIVLGRVLKGVKIL